MKKENTIEEIDDHTITRQAGEVKGKGSGWKGKAADDYLLGKRGSMKRSSCPSPLCTIRLHMAAIPSLYTRLKSRYVFICESVSKSLRACSYSPMPQLLQLDSAVCPV